MNDFELRNALIQTLENYQRCGLHWIQSDSALDPKLEQWVTQLRESQSAIDSQTPADPAPPRLAPTILKSTNPTPAGSLSADSASANYSSAGSASAEMTPGELESDRWIAPSLDDDSRKARFIELDQQIRACRLCDEICHFRHQTVFGEGPIRPTVCFMGEAPGADEDRMGVPFVGRAGQLLAKIIAAMQLRREDVYILNALKCRPPNNRTPSDHEVANCRPFVEAQLETLQPQFIVCLGAVAARSLLNVTRPIGQLRGKFYRYRGARVIITYHPSYLLRNEQAKRLVWEDMQMLMRELGIRLPKPS